MDNKRTERRLTNHEMGYLQSLDGDVGRVLLAFWRLFLGAERFDNADTVECTKYAIPKCQWLAISGTLANGKDLLANGVMIWMNSGPSGYDTE